jgi:AAA lid domain
MLIDLPGWVNGRDVTKLWEEAKSNRDERVYDSKEMGNTIIKNDV